MTYAAILRLVPKELWGKLAPAGAAGATFPILAQQVLEQIHQGCVKATFGELRHNAPAGLFTSNAEHDDRLIDLPLGEILAQLHPDTFARRPDQVRVEVTEEVPDLFGAKGERLATVRLMDKTESVQATNVSRQYAPSDSGTGGPLHVTPSMQTPPTVRPAPAVAPAAPASFALANPPAPTAPPPPPAPAFAFPKPKQTVPTKAQTSPAKPLPKATAPARPAPPLPPPPSLLEGIFFVALDVIAETWPDGVRQELARLKRSGAKVGLPPVDVCEGLKRQRIQYPWKTLRSWIQPASPQAGPSPYDEVMLELPLPKLTPLFLEYIRANPVNRRAAAAENITQFFRKAEESNGAGPDLLEDLLQQPAEAVRVESAFPPAAPALAVPAASAPGVVELPLTQIATGWPEPVLCDILQFSLTQATVRIPIEQIEAGLKAGRVELSWQELCVWLHPPSAPVQNSINGEIRLLLPLNLLAPLFLQQRSAGAAQRKTSVNAEIPDLFNSTVQTPAPAEMVPAANPVTPAPARPAAPTSLCALFNVPAPHDWTPHEIVQRTAKLPGLAGAMIALPDGLLVAAAMPSGFKHEIIAAFVPQIFGRMNQYSRELQMGECRGVGLTLEAGTFHVVSTGAIYLAVLCQPGALPPLPELQLIVGELNQHPR